MSKKLVDYIKSQLEKGYNISLIKEVTAKYGYSEKDINDAINEIYNPTVRHEIHLGKTTIIAIILIVLAIGISSFFIFGSSNAPSTLLDVNLESVATTAKPGESITFLKELKNLGSQERYDVEIKYELLDSGNKKVTEKTETVAIETSTSSQTRLEIPTNIAPGNYILRAVAVYGTKRAVATLPVKITSGQSTAGTPTCFDGIKNQDEENIDCGGLCKQCQSSVLVLDCNDKNICTQDFESSGKCIHNPIKPCCGNGICETKENCKIDCLEEVPQIIDELPSLEELKQLAINDPSKTQQYCERFEVPNLRDTCLSNLAEAQSNKEYCTTIVNARLKDVCYMTLAKKLKDNMLCDDVAIEGRKDSCLMTFVTDFKDYTVCPRITNTALKQSCEYLKQIYEINQNAQQAQNNPPITLPTEEETTPSE